MKKEFNRGQATRQVKYKKKFRILYTLLFLSLLASFVAYMVVWPPKFPNSLGSQLSLIQSKMSNLQKWLGNKKVAVHSELNKAKKIVDTKLDPHPNIEFEFYKTLPSVQVEKTIFSGNKKSTKKVAQSASLFDEKQIQNAFNEELKNIERGIK